MIQNRMHNRGDVCAYKKDCLVGLVGWRIVQKYCSKQTSVGLSPVTLTHHARCTVRSRAPQAHIQCCIVCSCQTHTLLHLCLPLVLCWLSVLGFCCLPQAYMKARHVMAAVALPLWTIMRSSSLATTTKTIIGLRGTVGGVGLQMAAISRCGGA